MTEVGCGDPEWGDKVARTRGDSGQQWKPGDYNGPKNLSPRWGYEYWTRVKEGLLPKPKDSRREVIKGK